MAQRVDTGVRVRGTHPGGPGGTTTGSASSLGPGRRIVRAPGAPIAALLLLISIAYTALAVHEAAHLRRVRGDGLITDGRLVVSADARWPGLRPGDEIDEVAGSGLSDRPVAYRFTEVPVHDDATLRAHHPGGGEVRVPLAVAPLPRLHAATAWLRVLSGALIVLLGALGFALRPGSKVGWIFYLFCFAITADMLFPIALARWLWIFPALEALTFSTSASLGVHTFCELPRRAPAIERRPWLVWLIYVPAIVNVAHVAIDPLGEAPGLFAAFWSLTTCVITLIILGRGYARARREGDARLVGQYRLLLAGITIGLVLPVLVHVVRSSLGFNDKWLVHLNGAPVIVYPLTIAIALLRRNVLGADRYTAVVVAYAATLAVVGAAGATLLVVLPLVITGQVGSSPLVLVLITAAASFGAAPLYRWLKRAVDRRFQRHGVSAEQLNARLREVVRVVATGDREAALSGSFEALAPLGAERAGLYVLDPARGLHALERARGDVEIEEVPSGGSLGAALRLDAPGGVAAFAAVQLPDAAQDELWALGFALAAAVPVRGVVGGFLAVGPRAGGSRYSSAEQSYLALLAAQVGLVLERGSDGGQVGRYRMEKRIGIGGMAEVHLAWQVGPGGFERRVALKRPLPHVFDDPELVAMFLDEARLAATLHHPNIAQVHEVGRDGATYYIAMEYVDGISLRTLMRANGRRPMPLPRALRIIDALLAALACAHDAVDARGRRLHLVHRDVTPSNLLLSVAGEVKLVDFGIALAAARLQVTRAGMVKGTPTYMSPEQKGGRDVDHRSDLFSAGVILHELLTGRPPWPDGPPPREETQPPLDLAAIDRELARVIRRTLAWYPADRFSSAAELRAALHAACSDVTPAPATELAAAVVRAREATASAQQTAEEPTHLAPGEVNELATPPGRPSRL